jgi:lipopolysaccharide assembly outer membrane protein LptD (OstA)
VRRLDRNAIAQTAVYVRAGLMLRVALLALLLALPCAAQNETPADNLLITASKAATWNDGPTNVLQLEGPVSIDLDRTRLTADNAVLWITPARDAVLGEQRCEIALIGQASLTQAEGVTRTGETLFVTAAVRGTIRVTANDRVVRNRSDSDLYKRAVTFRPVEPVPSTQPADNWLIQRPWLTPQSPTTQPAAATQPVPHAPVAFSADNVEGVKTPEGLIAFILSGNVKMFQRRPNDEFLELQADRAVIFTTLHSLREAEKSQQIHSAEDAVSGAYLEGDVRLVHTPRPGRGSDQRLTGNRVFYDFTTDRAILTQAVVHTFDPKANLPLIVRAQTVRQLSEGEFTAEHAQLTTSSFAKPSYSIGLDKAYIRQIETGDPQVGTYSEFSGQSATFQVYDVPVFYWPYLSGELTQRGAAFRNASISSGSRFGTSLVTQWGLFESLGKIPPKNTDITYQLDYFGKRGPAVGLDGKYTGGSVTDTFHDPWSFNGDFGAFFVHDTGTDDLGRRRDDVTPPTEERGRIDLRHQHILPDDWQLQLTLGYSSDPTFLEEWFPNQYYNDPPQQTSLYLKRQRETEALTFLVSKQFNNFVTAFNNEQEQAEVERLPEFGYHRLGDGILGDSLTFFSQNTFGGLDFRRSRYSLEEQGFFGSQSPGLPSFGTTGQPGFVVFRGDFRQELDYPFSAGRFRVVPYVVGRYSVYSNSPESEAKNRVFAAAGVRVTTAFWKVDDTVQNDLLDLHRLRHVVEPELNLFTSAENLNRTKVFQFDEPIDQINDITGAQLALHQRWQTKRGDAERWRSVDAFTLNLEGNFFTHKPNDVLMDPTKFRGLFFNSMPEASIPRNSFNTDATWRVSDTTTVLGDAEYNLDKTKLATASIGLAVQRGERLSYFLGQRYIEPLDSNILTGAISYQLTTKYTAAFRQSFDFGQSHSVDTQFTLIRHFDRFFVEITFRYDEVGSESGFLFNVIPEGLGTRSSGSTSGVAHSYSRYGY